MSDPSRILNRAAVREAFHARGARVPQGFLEDLEVAIAVVLRRASSGDIDPGPVSTPGESPPGASEREKAAREKFMTEGCAYLKESLLKEALREALGKDRIETAWVAHVNTIICLKVADAVGRRASRGAVSIPSSLLRFFMRSQEARCMTIESFLSRCKDPEFLASWERRAEAKANSPA